MKQLWTIIVVVGLFLAGALLTACSRAHMSPFHGVPTAMNWPRQVINPEAPTDPTPSEEVAGPIGEDIHRRYSDTYKRAIPPSLFREEREAFGSGTQ
ncbi:MAG: hypothetical protein ACE5JL_11995 [Dehalococcoidia bacterium]